jgi:hypothetical protein
VPIEDPEKVRRGDTDMLTIAIAFTVGVVVGWLLGTAVVSWWLWWIFCCPFSWFLIRICALQEKYFPWRTERRTWFGQSLKDTRRLHERPFGSSKHQVDEKEYMEQYRRDCREHFGEGER